VSAERVEVSEADWQRTVVETAEALGWVVCHTRRSFGGMGQGWVTATTLKGWPDLVLIRPPRLVFAELKKESGRLTDDQRRVLELLSKCDGAETHVWRPSDWHEVAAVLR
jgi:hypothetical protein